MEKCPICGRTDHLDVNEYQETCEQRKYMSEHNCCFHCACWMENSRKHDETTMVVNLNTEKGCERVRYHGFYAPKDYKWLKGYGGKLFFVHFLDNREIPYMFFNNVWCQGDISEPVQKLADEGNELFKNLVVNAEFTTEAEYKKWYNVKMQEFNTGDIVMGAGLGKWQAVPMVYNGFTNEWHQFDLEERIFKTNDDHSNEVIAFLSPTVFNYNVINGVADFHNDNGQRVNDQPFEQWVAYIRSLIENPQATSLGNSHEHHEAENPHEPSEHKPDPKPVYDENGNQILIEGQDFEEVKD